MNIVVSGINYKNTPIEIREKLNFTVEETKYFIRKIIKIDNIVECVLLSTCNRTEIYLFTENDNFDLTIIEEAFCKFKNLDLYLIKKYFYVYFSEEAVKHLCKVACGLDSMVLGEDQILGQVKSAFEISKTENTSGVILNKLFKEAVTNAKAVKTKTILSNIPVSISSLVVSFLVDRYKKDLKNKNIMIIGTGTIASIIIKNLDKYKLSKLYIVSRKDKDFLKNYGKVVKYCDRYTCVDSCDVILSATSCPHYTLTRDLMDQNIKYNKRRIIIDLALPRDIDNEIANMDNVEYFNIDHFKNTSNTNKERKIIESQKAYEYIKKYTYDFERWYEFRKYVPMLKEAQKYIDFVIDSKTKFVSEKTNLYDFKEREIIRNGMESLVKEIFGKFVYNIKNEGSKENINNYFSIMEEFFNGRYKED